MNVYIIFGLGLGDDESTWEVCDVKLSEVAAQERVSSLAQETGGEYKYEEWAAS